MHKISDFEMLEQLSLDTGWSIGETAFKRITTTLLEMSPVERILEFGSGPSSIRVLGCACQTFGCSNCQ